MKLEAWGGIVLTVPKDRRSGLLTPERIKENMRQTDLAALPVRGDCLEGAGVMDGGWVAVDFTHFPAPPRYKSRGGDGSEDICLCYAVFPGTSAPIVMCKVYDGVWGSQQMVGTRYKDIWPNGKFHPNCAMFAKEIFGVVFASWAPDGTLLWERDPSSFPNRLGTAPTIRGDNISGPVLLTPSDRRAVKGVNLCRQS